MDASNRNCARTVEARSGGELVDHTAGASLVPPLKRLPGFWDAKGARFFGGYQTVPIVLQCGDVWFAQADLIPPSVCTAASQGAVPGEV
jgi:hypothetical protein